MLQHKQATDWKLGKLHALAHIALKLTFLPSLFSCTHPHNCISCLRIVYLLQGVFVLRICLSVCLSVYLVCFGSARRIKPAGDTREIIVPNGAMPVTVTSLCNECFGPQEKYPNIKLNLLRGASAVRTQWLVVLTSRMSLQ